MRKTWSVINNIIGRNNDNSSISNVFKIDGRNEINPMTIANGFCEFFTNVGKHCADKIGKSKNTFSQYLGNNNMKRSIYLNPTSQEEIMNILKLFKPKKSTDCDNISMKLLQDLGHCVSYPISMIVNRSLSEGVVPKSMKVAKVVPIYKSKDHQLFTNYRPISLLPTVSKILEKVIHIRLYNFLSSQAVFYHSQYGFRAKHSTVHAVCELVHEILRSFEQRTYTLATFLDLSKAFDTIDHDILLHKLSHYGIRGIALQWFKSYLSDRKQLVCYNGHRSDQFEIKCGVPQGSVLGPLLFIIYTNDLSKVLTQAKCILFADDTTVYASSKNVHDLYSLMNAELQTLSDWFKANKLSVNATKTNYVIFSKSRLSSEVLDKNLFVDNECIERVASTKFLGVIIDEHLQWSEHIKYCCKKVASGVYALNMAKRYLSQKKSSFVIL